MRCNFCDEKLLRPNMPPGALITVPTGGFAHKDCAQQAWVTRKMFGKTKLDNIPTDELHELKTLVVDEINQRHNPDIGEVLDL